MTKPIIFRDSLSHCTYDLTYNRHIKPQNELQLGYFLAGLIDADGHISLQRYITINAHIRDLSVVHYLKVVLHGGGIYKYKKVQGCVYWTNIKSLVRLAHLISNKLKLPKKIESFNKAIAPYAKCGLCFLPPLPDRSQRQGEQKQKSSDTGVSLTNHWFAGFVQGDGCFLIRIRKPRKPGRSQQVEITLLIELKQEALLRSIVTSFGGNVYYRKSRDTYCYHSNNLTNARKLVANFDTYQVMGPSYRLYLCWRRALHLVFKKKHLTAQGLEEIKSLKALMTRLRS